MMDMEDVTCGQNLLWSKFNLRIVRYFLSHLYDINMAIVDLFSCFNHDTQYRKNRTRKDMFNKSQHSKIIEKISDICTNVEPPLQSNLAITESLFKLVQNEHTHSLSTNGIYCFYQRKTFVLVGMV